jgi:predicted NBD/HSP70 family sugar kinase
MATIVRPETIRRQNRSTVLAALREDGQMSRTKITQITGISAATVTTITADLLAAGVLVSLDDTDQNPTPRGRPRIVLSFNPDFACVGVLALQMNKITASILDYQGTTICETAIELPTRSRSSEQILTAISSTLEKMLKKGNGEFKNLMHIAVGIQGTTDVQNEILLWSPITKNKNIPIAAFLAKKFNIPTSLHNDCNMIACALRWKEPEIYHSDFAAILLSHGIGMGLYQNGQLVKGKYSSASEFGHMMHVPDGALCRCGRHGCIEAYAGDYAIIRRANRECGQNIPHDDIRPQALKEVLENAMKNVPDAVAAYSEAGQAIGAGLASLYALIDPFPVAFVGSGAKAHLLMDDAINKAIGNSQLGQLAIDTSIRHYPDETPLITTGCAITALRNIDENIRTSKLLKKDKDLQNVD